MQNGVKGRKPPQEATEAVHQAVQAETVPPQARSRRIIIFQLILVLFICAFSVLGAVVTTMPTSAIDIWITKSIQSVTYTQFADLMFFMSWLGFNPQAAIITILMACVLYRLGLHWEAVVASGAALLSGVVNLLVKELFQRPRPEDSIVRVFTALESYSFPSGHVMYFVIFFGFLWFLAFTLLKPSFKRGLLLVILSGLMLLVGISRIYLGEHWASDVIGGYLLGAVLLAGVIQVYHWGKRRFFVDQPVK